MRIDNLSFYPDSLAGNRVLTQKNLSFGNKECSYESDLFQKEIEKGHESETFIVLKELVKIQKEKGNKLDIAYFLEIIGKVFEENNYLTEAKGLFEKALKLKKNNPDNVLIDSYVHLQRIYEKLGMLDKANEYRLKLDNEVYNA